MTFSLKETGESYEDFLRRNRQLEIDAKDCLPENRQAKKEWDMHKELTELLEDKDVINLGWMNSFSSDSEAYYRNLIESDVKFKRIRQNGYWEYYNVEEKVVFKIDSGD